MAAHDQLLRKQFFQNTFKVPEAGGEQDEYWSHMTFGSKSFPGKLYMTTNFLCFQANQALSVIRVRAAIPTKPALTRLGLDTGRNS